MRPCTIALGNVNVLVSPQARVPNNVCPPYDGVPLALEHVEPFI